MYFVSFIAFNGGGISLVDDLGTYSSEYLGTTDNTPGLVPPALKF